MTNEESWCFAWINQKPSGEATRAALVKAARWNAGDIITVSFLDGDPSLQEKVKQAAKRWIGRGMANLMLDFRKNNNTDIRISFRRLGNWSAIGTECRTVNRYEPTMNYGDLKPNSAEEEIQRYVLHEFGHALGLIHEHQHPEAGETIHWNRQQIMKDLHGPPNNWPEEQIEFNMFKAYAKKDTNFGKFDKDSIMLYPIPKSWTTDGFSVGFNNDLSKNDKLFISQQYPEA
jgi:hypothetical protein